jgi:hypothetical protein
MSRALPLLLLLASCASADLARLRSDFALGDALFLAPGDDRAFAEAAVALADLDEPGLRPRLEFHLDRDVVKRKRLPERCLVAVATALGRYPSSAGARAALWAALADPAELPAVRAASFKSLRASHPDDLEERVAALPCPPGDAWLADFQRRLR